MFGHFSGVSHQRVGFVFDFCFFEFCRVIYTARTACGRSVTLFCAHAQHSSIVTFEHCGSTRVRTHIYLRCPEPDLTHVLAVSVSFDLD